MEAWFGGSLRSTVDCLCCDFSSPTLDRFFDLSLELYTGNSFHTSVRSALNSYFTTELLEEYKCAPCDVRFASARRARSLPAPAVVSRAHKCLRIASTPNVLTLHLKRFATDASRNAHKLRHHVQFETELDLGPFLTSDAPALYSLFAVVVHAGPSLAPGHYYTYALVPSSPSALHEQSWFCFDDARVTSVTLDVVLSSEAYLLFYSRVPPPSPSIDTVPTAPAAPSPPPSPRLGDALEQLQLDVALTASAATPRGRHRGVPEPTHEPTNELAVHQPAESASPSLDGTLRPIVEPALESHVSDPDASASTEPDPCDNAASRLQSSVPAASRPAITPSMPISTRARTPPPIAPTNARLEALLQDLDEHEPQDAPPDDSVTCCVCGSAEGPLLHSAFHDGQPFTVCTRAGLPLPLLSSHVRDNCESCISVIRETTCDFSSLVFSVSSSPSSSDLIALRCATTGSSDIDSLVITESHSARLVVHRSVSGDSPALPLVTNGSINPSFLPWSPPDGEASACAARSFRRRWAPKPAPAPLCYRSATDLANTFHRLLTLEVETSIVTAADTGLTQVAVRWGTCRDDRPTLYIPNLLPRDFKYGARFDVTLQSTKRSRPGTVTHVDSDMVGISLDHLTTTAPWSNDTCGPSARFSISRMWQSIPIARMHLALDVFAQVPGAVGPHLRALLLGHPLAALSSPPPSVLPNTLNTSQRAALMSSLVSTLTLIQGPPGTGKTATSAEIVRNWNHLGHKVLVVAQSNSAVDNLALAISRVGVRLIRHFSSSGPPPGFPSELTTEHYLDNSPFSATDDKASAARFSYLRNLLKQGVGYLQDTDQKAYTVLLKRALTLALNSVSVVCCTCSSAADISLKDQPFEFCLMDEATQAFEPDVYVPLVCGIRRLVLVGDPKQLGPVVTNSSASEAGLGTSLFERLLRCEYPYILLDTQYRMHPSLAEFASRQFYDSRVVSGVSADDRAPAPGFPWPDAARPCLVANIRNP